VLIADEPTTALDVTVQFQILGLLRELCVQFDIAMLFITHDMGVIAQLADRVAVMYAGRIVEYGSARDVLMMPCHPYTIGMLASTVDGESRGKDIEAIPGSPPDLRFLPQGCSFAPRCRFAATECAEIPPPTIVSPGHTACCLRMTELRALAPRPASYL
jgi:peptide/nickel transport system ATP-binding protein